MDVTTTRADGRLASGRRRSGFTLVELLVVIAIIGVLVALLLPAVQAAREAARRSSCMNNMRQIGLAIHNFESARRQLPVGTTYTGTTKDGKYGTWASQILPNLELQAAHDRMDYSKPMWDRSGTNNDQTAGEITLPVYTCVSDEESRAPILPQGRGESRLVAGGGMNNPSRAQGLWYTGSLGPTEPDACPFCPEPKPSYCCRGCSYGTIAVTGRTEVCAGKVGDSSVGMFTRLPIGYRFSEITDGLSQTLMFGETLPYHCIWNCVFCVNFPLSSTAVPLNLMESDSGARDGSWPRVCGFKSMHPSGAHLAMGDASIHYVAQSIDYRVFNELGTRAGGEATSIP